MKNFINKILRKKTSATEIESTIGSDQLFFDESNVAIILMISKILPHKSPAFSLEKTEHKNEHGDVWVMKNGLSSGALSTNHESGSGTVNYIESNCLMTIHSAVSPPIKKPSLLSDKLIKIIKTGQLSSQNHTSLNEKVYNQYKLLTIYEQQKMMQRCIHINNSQIQKIDDLIKEGKNNFNNVECNELYEELDTRILNDYVISAHRAHASPS